MILVQKSSQLCLSSSLQSLRSSAPKPHELTSSGPESAMITYHNLIILMYGITQVSYGVCS